MNGTEFAVTFPRTELAPKLVADRIKANDTLVNLLVKFAVVQEEHKDGGHHLHLYFQYKKKVRFSFKHFDMLLESPEHPEGRRGNYQTVRSRQGWLRYLCKDQEVVGPEVLLFVSSDLTRFHQIVKFRIFLE